MDHENDRLYELVSQTLTTVRYKPDTTFDARRKDSPGYSESRFVELIIRRQLPDSTQPDRVIPVGGTFIVPPTIMWAIDPKADFLSWLWTTVLEMERHEAGEWFRVDGKLPYDPHASTVRTA